MKNSIKVANIILEGRFGGPQSRILQVAKQLRETDVNTTVIFPSLDSEKFEKKLEDSRINYRKIKLHRLTKDLSHLLKYIFFFFTEVHKIYRALKEGQFDIVHVSGGVWQIKGAIAGTLAGVKVLWHLNDTQSPYLLRFLFKRILQRLANGFIVSSQEVKKYYSNCFGNTDKPIFLVRPPVDVGELNPNNSFSNSKQLSDKRINIVSIGNINPAKGYEYFIKMAAKLETAKDNLVFYVVGDKNRSKTYFSRLSHLRSRLELDSLHFLGYSSDIKNILNATDIYVCSSISESGPMTLFEAMAMKKAIVTTNVGDVADLITHGESGFVVPPKKPKLLAKYVKKLIDKKSLRASFGEEARKVAKKKLDVKVAARNHMEAYRAIL